MKKFISIILVFTLLAVTFCGCTTSTGTQQEPAEASRTEADDYPKKPITINIPGNPGGSTDTAFRLITPYLEKELGTTINIINHSTGGGWIDWGEVAAGKADGYLLANISFPAFFCCYDPELKQDLRVDDYQLIANLVTDPNVLIFPKKSNIKTLEEFVDYASKTENLVCGATGVAGDDHLALLKLQDAFPAMKENIEPLQSIGVPEVITNLLGGIIDFAVCNVGDLKSLLEDDLVNVICVFHEERVGLVPDIPTFNEQAKEMGINIEITNGSARGVAMKKGGDPVIIEKLTTAFKNALDNDGLKKEYENMFYTWDGITGKQYEDLAQKELESFKKVMYLLGW